MNASTRLNHPDEFARYLRLIRTYPMLSQDEEAALLRAWHERQDRAAAHKLVTSHLRLVAKIAVRYRGYGLPLSDLISEGTVGMMRALWRFDPNRGVRLATYAMWWIRASMQEYILNSWSLVKIGTTAAQKKLFFNLRRLKNLMQSIDDGELTAEQTARISVMLDVREQDVLLMNGRLAAPDLSLNVAMHPDEDDQWQDWLADTEASHAEILADREEFLDRKKALSLALEVLDKRERHIVTERWLKEDAQTLKDLAEEYNVSRERVRQIEVRALAKLQNAVSATMRARESRVAKTV